MSQPLLESLIERVIEIQLTRGCFIEWDIWYPYIFRPLYTQYCGVSTVETRINYDQQVNNMIARDYDNPVD